MLQNNTVLNKFNCLSYFVYRDHYPWKFLLCSILRDGQGAVLISPNSVLLSQVHVLLCFAQFLPVSLYPVHRPYFHAGISVGTFSTILYFWICQILYRCYQWKDRTWWSYQLLFNHTRYFFIAFYSMIYYLVLHLHDSFSQNFFFLFLSVYGFLNTHVLSLFAIRCLSWRFWFLLSCQRLKHHRRFQETQLLKQNIQIFIQNTNSCLLQPTRVYMGLIFPWGPWYQLSHNLWLQPGS